MYLIFSINDNKQHAESLPQTLAQSPPRQELGTARGRGLQGRRAGLRDPVGPAEAAHLRSVGGGRSRQSRRRWRHALSTARRRWTRNDAGGNFQRLFWRRHAGGHGRWRSGRNALLLDRLWTGHALSRGWWTAAETATAAATTTTAAARWRHWHAAAVDAHYCDFANVLLLTGYVVVLRWRWWCENHAGRESIF